MAEDEVTLNVMMVADPDSPALFVNHFEIRSNLHEFSLLAKRMPTKLSPAEIESAQADGHFIVEPDVQLIVPPTVMPSLISALTIALEGYEARYGAVLRS